MHNYIDEISLNDQLWSYLKKKKKRKEKIIDKNFVLVNRYKFPFQELTKTSFEYNLVKTNLELL